MSIKTRSRKRLQAIAELNSAGKARKEIAAKLHCPIEEIQEYLDILGARPIDGNNLPLYRTVSRQYRWWSKK